MRVLAALAFMTLLLLSDAALACSCRRPNAKQIVEGSAAIFTGVAQRTTRAQGENATTFRITGAHRGVKRGQTITVYHRGGGRAACGVIFQPGRSYVLNVHRNEDNNRLTASSCSLFIMQTDAGKEALQLLNQ